MEQSAKERGGHGLDSEHQPDRWEDRAGDFCRGTARAPARATTDASRTAPLQARRIRIEAIRLRNFKVFRNAAIGPLPRISLFVGANGSGKSTLFDAIEFLRDCMVNNVAIALGKRGGYREVRTREANGEIGIEVKFRVEAPGVRRLVTYALEIGAEDSDSPYVKRETLRYRRGRGCPPVHVVDFARGVGDAIADEDGGDAPDAQPARETQTIDPGSLAVKALGQFRRFGTAFALRDSVERWHVSDFHMTAAQLNGKTAFREHLSADGANLGVVTRRLQERHPAVFDEIRKQMGAFVPGITSIDTETLPDGRVLLKFHEFSYKQPFVASRVSDGTLQLFAHLVMLHDPLPHPLLCVEEPEDRLYQSVLKHMVDEFHEYAARGGGQVMLATHSPEMLDHVTIDQVFWLAKKPGGTLVQSAGRDLAAADLARQGELPGHIWTAGCFEGANPDE